MRLVGIKETDDTIMLRYKATYRMSWSRVLDFSQIFLNDVSKNISGLYRFLVAGAPLTPVNNIKEGLLYKTKEFKEESGGIVISGKSQMLESTLRLTVYNQLDIVDIEVWSDEKIAQEVEENNHLLDKYMDSLEINMVARDSQRYVIDLFGRFLQQGDEETSKTFRNICNNLGATPFPEKKQEQVIEIQCPCCQEKIEFDESRIPFGATYDVQCPKCKMFLKRKKI